MKNHLEKGRELEEAENFSKELDAELGQENPQILHREKNGDHSGEESESDEWDLLQTNKNRLNFFFLRFYMIFSVKYLHFNMAKLSDFIIDFHSFQINSKPLYFLSF